MSKIFLSSKLIVSDNLTLTQNCRWKFLSHPVLLLFSTKAYINYKLFDLLTQNYNLN